MLVSSRMSHAQLAGGQPVVYAGTASFEQGAMAWWSNYSGTFQPIAEFRAQAALPDDKFVPWQRLQAGGISMQRGTFQERMSAAPPELAKPGRPNPAAAPTSTSETPGNDDRATAAQAKRRSPSMLQPPLQRHARPRPGPPAPSWPRRP